MTGAIDRGLVALVGTTHGDDLAIARDLARRVAGYRVFPDGQGKTNLSVRDIGGAANAGSKERLTHMDRGDY